MKRLKKIRAPNFFHAISEDAHKLNLKSKNLLVWKNLITKAIILLPKEATIREINLQDRAHKSTSLQTLPFV
jgi:hypothetical protein